MLSALKMSSWEAFLKRFVYSTVIFTDMQIDQGTSDTQSRKAGTQSTRKAKDWTRKMDRALMMNAVTYHPVWPSISKV